MRDFTVVLKGDSQPGAGAWGVLCVSQGQKRVNRVRF